MSDVPSSQYIYNFTYYIDNRKKADLDLKD